MGVGLEFVTTFRTKCEALWGRSISQKRVSTLDVRHTGLTLESILTSIHLIKLN